MSVFLDNAGSILQTAEDAIRSGHSPTNFVILLGCESGMRMVADSDWSLESLRAEHGARTAYRVSVCANVIRVEGKEHGKSCTLEKEAPARSALWLLGSPIPRYSISDVAALTASSSHYSNNVSSRS